jgi:hypothetical protein
MILDNFETGFSDFPDQKYGKKSMENPVFRISRHQSIDPTRLPQTPPEVDMKSIDALREMKDKLQTALKANGFNGEVDKNLWL